MKHSGERIVAAMSGGVDSTVAAALLVREGREVIGVTLQLQSCDEVTTERSCCSAAATSRAGGVASRLGIPHYVLDFRKEFENEVLRHTWAEYSRGRTPNPCVICNEKIKFGLLFEFARSVGAGKIATGHYARTEKAPGGSVFLQRGLFSPKDQSYFLFSVPESRLSSVVFPVGGLSKDRVRSISKELGFVEEISESQDACFAVRGKSYSELLRRRFGAPANPGKVIGPDGTVVGRHDGIHKFTVGQGRKLGIALGEKCWVKSIDPETACVYITTESGDLLSRGLTASVVKWNGGCDREGPLECLIQVRYRQAAVRGTVEFPTQGIVKVQFQNPIRAVAPGQAVVFYDGDRVLGGGWIESSY